LWSSLPKADDLTESTTKAYTKTPLVVLVIKLPSTFSPKLTLAKLFLLGQHYQKAKHHTELTKHVPTIYE